MIVIDNVQKSRGWEYVLKSRYANELSKHLLKLANFEILVLGFASTII